MKNKHSGALFRYSGIIKKKYLRGIIIFAITMMALFATPSVMALQTVPYKMNFQGRLTDSSGAAMPDGLYNMKFRIYDAASGGALQWSETREVADRVQVTGGLFSTQLGDVTSLPPGIFTNQNLYFEIELPTPATATCSTAGCASYSEGPMTPRNKLASSAFALNADQIDGIDSSSLARIDTTNTFTSANTFSATVTIGSSNAANKFVINDNSGTSLLTADTAATVVKIGNPSAATLASVRLLTTNAEFSGTVRIGSATNGVDISAGGIVLSGTARPLKTVNFEPEYAGATFTGDGTNNDGSLSSDFCSPSSLLNINTNTTGCDTDPAAGPNRSYNYYFWTAPTQTTSQDYDIYVRAKLPSDYSAGSMANLTLWASADIATSDIATISLYDDTSGTPCSTSGNAAISESLWSKITVSAPLGSCSLVADNSITFKVHLASDNNSNGVRVGNFSYQYRGAY